EKPEVAIGPRRDVTGKTLIRGQGELLDDTCWRDTSNLARATSRRICAHGEPEVAIGPRRDVTGPGPTLTIMQGELLDDTRWGDTANLVSATLGEPEVAVGPCHQRNGRAEVLARLSELENGCRAGYPELGDHQRVRDPAQRRQDFHRQQHHDKRAHRPSGCHSQQATRPALPQWRDTACLWHVW